MGAPTVATVRVLHTADWHVGKSLKGLSRLDEQEQVLREIVRVTREQEVDAVLVAGDLYDSAAPSAAAQRLVVRTLMALARTEAQVVVIAGNHDHAATFDAYRPFAGAAGVTLVGSVRTAETGGVVEFTSRGGERATVAVLPFLSQRYAVRAAELVAQSPAENTSTYDQHVRSLVRALTAGFRTDAVNLVMAHLTVLGGTFGGGERAAQSIFEYSVPAAVFPPDAHYVALGHLHRRQALAAPVPVHYSGAPLGRRLRGAGQHERRAAGRGHAHHAGPGHGHPDHGRAAAADGARHGRRAGRHAAATSGTTCCASSCASARGPGCARRSRSCCRTRWRCG